MDALVHHRTSASWASGRSEKKHHETTLACSFLSLHPHTKPHFPKNKTSLAMNMAFESMQEAPRIWEKGDAFLLVLLKCKDLEHGKKNRSTGFSLLFWCCRFPSPCSLNSSSVDNFAPAMLPMVFTTGWLPAWATASKHPSYAVRASSLRPRWLRGRLPVGRSSNITDGADPSLEIVASWVTEVLPDFPPQQYKTFPSHLSNYFELGSINRSSTE